MKLTINGALPTSWLQIVINGNKWMWGDWDPAENISSTCSSKYTPAKKLTMHTDANIK